MNFTVSHGAASKTAGHRQRPLTRRPQGRRPIFYPELIIWSCRTAVFGAIILAWELVARLGYIPSEVLPDPISVMWNLPAVVTDQVTLLALRDTVLGWSIGLAIALPSAVLCGLLLGSSTFAYRSTRIPVDMMRVMPGIAILPLAILMFGATIELKIGLVAFSAFWVILIQTIHGVWDVDPAVMSMARAYRLSGMTQVVFILTPSIGAFIATGFRLGAVIALLAAMGTELLASVNGIGFLILQAQSIGDMVRTYDVIIVAMAMSLVVNVVIRKAEHKILKWHPAYREGATR